MGDRGNVLIGDLNSRVFLYTHWGGSILPQVVQTALQREERWGDAPYLARIVFAEMIREGMDLSTRGQDIANELMETTGFGIATYMPDNEHTVIYLDASKQMVHYITEHTAREWKEITDDSLKSWTMAEFIKLSQEEIEEDFQ